MLHMCFVKSLLILFNIHLFHINSKYNILMEKNIKQLPNELRLNKSMLIQFKWNLSPGQFRPGLRQSIRLRECYNFSTKSKLNTLI